MSSEPTLSLLQAVNLNLTHVIRLQHDRRYRDRRGLYFVEGVRNFTSAHDSGAPIDTLLYSERLLTSVVSRKLVRQQKRAGTPFMALSPEQFRRISKTRQASGVAALVRQSVQTLAGTQPGSSSCWVVLDLIRNFGNLGTLMRSAAAVGAAGFILLNPKTDPFDPATIRASMGAFFGLPIIRAKPEELRGWVQQHGLLVVGASPDSSHAYNEVAYRRPTVLMLGEERKGLTEVQRALCHSLVRIPMAAGHDSLNVGVAGSLLMYEIARAGP